jgi:hypothetical protein
MAVEIYLHPKYLHKVSIFFFSAKSISFYDKWKQQADVSMVFCYQNCSDLLWEKIFLVIEKNFW